VRVRVTKVWAVAGLLLVLALVGGAGLYLLFGPGPEPASPDGTVVFIRRGLPADSIAILLRRSGVVRSAKQFLLASRLLGKTDELKWGRYRFPPRVSCSQAVYALAEGKVEAVKVTIPEGWRSWEIAALLRDRVGADSARFIHLVHSDSLRKTFGIEGPSLEGYLFPDTYYLAWGMPEEEIIRTLVRRCLAALDSSIRARADSTNLTLHQLLTLASLVEGEAKVDSERAMVAAVYLNRLRKGMRLEACPTIQYLLGGPPRRLLKKDLEIESPYNTYLHPGLPPGPVNNPGLKSVSAVLHPAPVDYLFLVARGDGGHYFSRTFAEHVRQRRQLDRLRREMGRQNQTRGN